jgi:hypothetical protein
MRRSRVQGQAGGDRTAEAEGRKDGSKKVNQESLSAWAPMILLIIVWLIMVARSGSRQRQMYAEQGKKLDIMIEILKEIRDRPALGPKS